MIIDHLPAIRAWAKERIRQLEKLPVPANLARKEELTLIVTLCDGLVLRATTLRKRGQPSSDESDCRKATNVTADELKARFHESA